MAKNQRRVGEDRSEIVGALPLACSDELAAVEFMERQRWGDTPACPRCGDLDVVQVKAKDGTRSKRFLWRCHGCKRQFTVRIGTVMEDSRIPLRHWCYAFWAACASKKGVSALQIKRMTGLSYKSALFLMHRIRFAMTEDHKGQPKLSGTIEVDETYVGGRARRRNTRSQAEHWARKTPVVALLERDGKLRAAPVIRVNAKTLKTAIYGNVDYDSRIMTDEASWYQGVGRSFRGGHHTVNHSKEEYSRGDVTTNRVEGFFSILKRGIFGTFHSVSKKHLHRYVAEFEFKYNTRKLDDGERLTLAIQGADGKRLTYRA